MLAGPAVALITLLQCFTALTRAVGIGIGIGIGVGYLTALVAHLRGGRPPSPHDKQNSQGSHGDAQLDEGQHQPVVSEPCEPPHTHQHMETDKKASKAVPSTIPLTVEEQAVRRQPRATGQVLRNLLCPPARQLQHLHR